VTVVVDHAHTDDALRNLLETARPLAHGRLVTVFGCGRRSHRTKRPLMGAVAPPQRSRRLTSDNRAARIRRGSSRRCSAASPPTRAATRRVRWRSSIGARRCQGDRVAPGDVVLIAGKGHETYQVIGDRVLPFDDRRGGARALNGGGRTPGVI
jgi:UDP-N-acetylmuramoyl-L-alanyl-D-glutamate--2,6-diaminopimelate ligase